MIIYLPVSMLDFPKRNSTKFEVFPREIGISTPMQVFDSLLQKLRFFLVHLGFVFELDRCDPARLDLLPPVGGVFLDFSAQRFVLLR